MLLLCAVFNAVSFSGRGRSVQSHKGERAQGRLVRLGRQGALPCQGAPCTARSASPASKARTDSSSRHHCRTERVGEPLDGFAIAASHDCCSRRLSPVLAMPPLSSTLRACAWPVYLCCFSCSGDLQAPSVPPRAIAVARRLSSDRLETTTFQYALQIGAAATAGAVNGHSSICSAAGSGQLAHFCTRRVHPLDPALTPLSLQKIACSVCTEIEMSA